MADPQGSLPLSFHCPWYQISSQMTAPSWWKGGTCSSQSTSYPFRTSSTNNSPSSFRKEAQLHLLALAESRVCASVNHQGGGGAGGVLMGQGCVTGPVPQWGQPPRPQHRDMLLLLAEGALGAKRAETADVPSKHQLCVQQFIHLIPSSQPS